MLGENKALIFNFPEKKKKSQKTTFAMISKNLIFCGQTLEV